MPSLLFPLGLAALAAWLLPLLLHLVRRERDEPVPFAALRWLRTTPRPRRRLRFDEWLLLLLRLGLVAALALLLARPVLDGGGGDRDVVLLHPALPADSVVPGDDVRWLAPGFPATTQPVPGGVVPVASLLREFDASLEAGATLRVIVPAVVDGADGERPQLSRAVDWQVRGDAAPQHAAPRGIAVPRLVVRADDAHAADARWLRAAREAWRQAGHAAPTSEGVAVDANADARAGDSRVPALEVASDDPTGVDTLPDTSAFAALDATSDLPASDHILAHLHAGKVPEDLIAWVHGGGTLLLPVDADWPVDGDGAATWRDDDGHSLLRATPLGAGRVLQWQVTLRPDALPALLDAGFPRTLREQLQPEPPLPTRAAADAIAPRDGGAAFVVPPRPLDDTVVWIVLALFALERLVATGRRERRA